MQLKLKVFFCVFIATNLFQNLIAQRDGERNKDQPFLKSDGTSIYIATSQGAFQLMEGGNKWRKLAEPINPNDQRAVKSPCNCQIKDFYYQASTILSYIWCGTSEYYNYQGAYISHDNGNTLQQLQQGWISIAFMGKDIFLLGGIGTYYGRKLFSSNDGGKTFQDINSKLPPQTEIQVLSSDGTLLYAGGKRAKKGLGLPFSSIFLMSKDKGNTWTEVDKGFTDKKYAKALDELILWNNRIVAKRNSYEGHSDLCILNEEKTEWQPIFAGEVYSYCVHNKELYIATKKFFKKSSNYGASWEDIPIDLKMNNIISLASAGNFLYAVIPDTTKYYDTYLPTMTLKVSSDNGKNWTDYKIQKKIEEAVNSQKNIEEAERIAKINANYPPEDLSLEDGTLPKNITNYATTVSVYETNALALEAEGQIEDAIIVFDLALTTNPNNSNAMNELALLYMNIGNYQTAYEMNTKALKLDKTNPRLLLTGARIALFLNKPDEAIPLLDKLIASDPFLGTAQVHKAYALEAKGQSEDALKAYGKALLADHKTFSAYRGRATLLIRLGRYEEALLDLNLLIKNNEKSTSAHKLRGLALYRLAKYADALLAFDKSIQLAPNNYTALTYRGLTKIVLQQSTTSIKADFDEALAFNKNYSEAYYGYWLMYNRENQDNLALEKIIKALELDSKSEAYLQAKAETLLKLKKFNELLVLAEKQLNINDKNPTAWLNKAFAQSELKNEKAAIETLNSAILKMPNDASFYNARSFVYQKMGNKTAADADAAKAKQLEGK